MGPSDGHHLVISFCPEIPGKGIFFGQQLVRTLSHVLLGSSAEQLVDIMLDGKVGWIEDFVVWSLGKCEVEVLALLISSSMGQQRDLSQQCAIFCFICSKEF